jgi:hypothetical protein
MQQTKQFQMSTTEIANMGKICPLTDRTKKWVKYNFSLFLTWHDVKESVTPIYDDAVFNFLHPQNCSLSNGRLKEPLVFNNITE